MISLIPARARLSQLPETIRRNLAGLLFVLLLHLGLALLFLSLAPPLVRQKAADALLFRYIETPAAENIVEPAPEPQEQAESTPETSPEPTPEPPPQPPAEPVKTPKPVDPPALAETVDLPPAETTALAAPPAAPPPAPPRRVYGPPDVSQKPPPDSVRVEGNGPNGEPLYAAQWYREPYDNELRGYLSTSRGPGWGLVACRTAANYRVEDCVIVDEYPYGSGIARSVHAAAWQFRVRPPRIGGKEQVGEWVRIRIDYGQRGEFAR